MNKYEIQMGICFSWLLFIFHQLDSHFKFSISTNQKKKETERIDETIIPEQLILIDEWSSGMGKAWRLGEEFRRDKPFRKSGIERVAISISKEAFRWLSLSALVFGKDFCNLSVDGSGRYIRLSYVA